VDERKSVRCPQSAHLCSVTAAVAAAKKRACDAEKSENKPPQRRKQLLGLEAGNGVAG